MHEFKEFENKVQIIYNSNYKRLLNSLATGIMDALKSIVSFKDDIKERGGFEDGKN